MTGFQIRRMYASDVDHLTWAGGRRYLEHLTEELLRPNTVFLIAEQERDIISLGAVTHEASPDTSLLRFLHTHPHREGHGIATALMFNLESLIYDRGDQYAELNVESSNIRALSLFRLLRYEVVERNEGEADTQSGVATSPYLNREEKLKMRKNLWTVESPMPLTP